MVNACGEAQHHMCTSNELMVQNSRAKSNRYGKETFRGPYGKSVLDYAIVHKDMLADMQRRLQSKVTITVKYA